MNENSNKITKDRKIVMFIYNNLRKILLFSIPKTINLEN